MLHVTTALHLHNRLRDGRVIFRELGELLKITDCVRKTVATERHYKTLKRKDVYINKIEMLLVSVNEMSTLQHHTSLKSRKKNISKCALL